MWSLVGEGSQSNVFFASSKAFFSSCFAVAMCVLQPSTWRSLISNFVHIVANVSFGEAGMLAVHRKPRRLTQFFVCYPTVGIQFEFGRLPSSTVLERCQSSHFPSLIVTSETLERFIGFFHRDLRSAKSTFCHTAYFVPAEPVFCAVS